MLKPTWFNSFVTLCACIGCFSYAIAQPPVQLPVQPPVQPQRPLRELFVPIEELDVLLGNDTRRVYMTRADYEDLLLRAHVNPEKRPPAKLSLLSANYKTEASEGRIAMHAELLIEVLDKGLQVLPLQFDRLGIRAAQLDNAPASLAKNDQGQTVVFLEGIGQHRLTLELVMPIASDAAQQTLQFQIPTAPTGSMELVIPGNIEIKSGASVVSREVDDATGATHFKILPTAAPMTIVMSLNNRKLRDQSTVVARGVLIAEITQAYERLHAAMSMAVLNGAQDEFRFAIDDDLEVNSVSNELMSRWSVEKVDGQQQLVVNLRTPTTERTVLNIRLDRVKRTLDAWRLPTFQPIRVAGYSAVVGILSDERLISSAIEAESLIAIDSSLLTSALPASLMAAEPGSPKLNAIAAFYAAQHQYALTAQFSVKSSRVVASTSTLMSVSDRGLVVDGGFTLMPQNEKLFFVEFECPANWTIDWVKTTEQQTLKFDQFVLPAGNVAGQLMRIRVVLATGIPAGGQESILFRAKCTPDNWLGKWESQSIQLPKFSLLSMGDQFGAVAVALQDDLLVTPETTQGLLVMNNQEKARFKLSEQTTAVAYRFESANWQAALKVSRTSPRSTAQLFSFAQLKPDSLISHTEISFDVKQARLQTVAFTLPESTPGEVAIRGLGDATVKETTSSLIDGRRLWTVQLAERKSGAIRLAIDFTQPLKTEDPTEATLPIVRAQDVAYQSGAIAVEGHSELEIELTKNPRAVDIGELVDAEYQVGKRLIGVFGYVGVGDEVAMKIARRPVHRLPTTIVERAELVTLVSSQGISQTAARFKMRTKAAYIESRLPEGARLWSVLLDGKPALPQREKDRVLLAIPASGQVASRDLQLVYETSADPVSIRGQIYLRAPELYERELDETEQVLIPIADMKWDVVLPNGYAVAFADGNLQPSSPMDAEFSLEWLLKRLWEIGGGREQLMPSVSVRYSDKKLAGEAIARENFGILPPTPATGSRRSGSTGNSLRMGRAAPPGNTDGELLMNERETLPSSGTALLMDRTDALPSESARELNARMDQSAAAAPIAQALSAPGQLDDLFGSVSSAGKANFWAMEGVRSLMINLDSGTTGKTISLNSLGVEPYANLTLVHESRLNWLAALVGIVIFIIGLLFVPDNRSARLRFYFAVALIAVLAPLVTGWTVELAPITGESILSLFALATCKLLGQLWRSLVQRVTRESTPITTSVTASASANSLAILLALVCSIPSSALAQSAVESQPAGTIVTSAEQLAALFKAFGDSGKVQLPADSVVIPFDAKQMGKWKESGKLLVPYESYIELWNRANPGTKIEEPKLSINYAWTAASYTATLEANDTLRMTGTATIEQFTDKEIAIPLPLSGCVIESAVLDGHSPRMQMLAVEPQITQAVAKPEQGVPAAMFMLYTQGKGRKQLELTLRWQLDKRSGWRSIEGVLPSGPASQLTLAVSKPKTEVRLIGGFDKGSFETANPSEQIVTTLGSDGRLSLQWRDKITEASVDQGLTVQARSVFDIQEDALKLAWHGQFEFRRGRRESFTLLVPKDYLIEKVVGANIRGWTVKPADDSQQLDIELLRAVSDRETLIVFISRQTAIDPQVASQVTVPQIRVPEAMLHQGDVAVRRSILLDVRADATPGLTRIESIDESSWMAAHEIAGILPIRVYQAYRYSQVPFDVKLTVNSIQSKMRAQSQSLLKISQLERTLESRLLISSTDRPIYRLQVSLPAEWKMQPPELPGEFQWSLNPAGNRQLLQIYIANGQQVEFPVLLRGKIDSSAQPNATATLPQIEVINAEQQGGSIVVQADPAYDVRPENLQGCELVLLETVRNWLASKQRESARTVIRFDNSKYSGELVVSARTPVINSFSVTNVKFTDRAIEETLFIEANIRSAGIGEYVFLMPARMATAKIQAPLLRQKIIEPVTDTPEMVRVRLLLQDAIMGQFRVVVEHDRELTRGPHTAPLPVIETGSTDRRLVTLENVGRDELITGTLDGFEKVDRTQLQQQSLADLLGGRSSQAFVVHDGATKPALTFETKAREVLATAGARIGLAQTLLIVDEMGTYRATQEYRVENRTEPFLEIEMPKGSRMWTAQVAGEPIKPAVALNVMPGAVQRVRIPLIKTAEGDLDYAVVIKYGGKIAKPNWLARVQFPLIHTLNINVELSQVRLRLPESLDWFNFDGTLGKVESESDLHAGWLAYRTRQLTELSQLLSSGSKTSDYTKIRALNCLDELQTTIQQNNIFFSKSGEGSGEFRRELNNNSAALENAQQQRMQLGTRQAVNERDNRDVFDNLYGNQSNGRSFNALSELGGNFPTDALPKSLDAAKDVQVQQNAWIAQNKLDVNNSGDISKARFKQSAEPAKPVEQFGKLAAPFNRDPSVLGLENVEKKLNVPQADKQSESQVDRYERKLQQKRGGVAQQAAMPNQPMPESAFTTPPGIPESAFGGRASIANSQGQIAEGKGEMRAPGGGGMGGGGLGGDVAAGSQPPTATAQNTSAANMPADSPVAQNEVALEFQAASDPYMASLEVELPQRGREFFFSTPRGEVELSAQAVATRTYKRLYAIVAVLMTAVAVWAAYVLLVRLAMTRWGVPVIACVLAILGAGSLVSSYLPIYGCLAILAAVVVVATKSWQADNKGQVVRA